MAITSLQMTDTAHYTTIVRTRKVCHLHPMKNITLSAAEPLIEAARQHAAAQHTTLNAEFRRWLESYAQRRVAVTRSVDIIEQIRSYTSTGGQKFTRDALNERR